jgi:hypothetical protein
VVPEACEREGDAMTEQTDRETKPLSMKAYGHIGHLPGSRIGPGDHKVNDGQAAFCLEKCRKTDRITVTEKLDGSCCAVAKLAGVGIVPLSRAGYRADTSPYRQHHLFAQWVYEHQDWFDLVLDEGERLVGEWMAQAHGTRYALRGEPFRLFDIMRGHERTLWDDLAARLADFGDGWLDYPPLLHDGGALSIEDALAFLGEHGHAGAIDRAEGVVYRVEARRDNGVWYCNYLAKFVWPDKVDGSYLPEMTGGEPVWNDAKWLSGRKTR